MLVPGWHAYATTHSRSTPPPTSAGHWIVEKCRRPHSRRGLHTTLPTTNGHDEEQPVPRQSGSLGWRSRQQQWHRTSSVPDRARSASRYRHDGSNAHGQRPLPVPFCRPPTVEISSPAPSPPSDWVSPLGQPGRRLTIGNRAIRPMSEGHASSVRHYLAQRAEGRPNSSNRWERTRSLYQAWGHFGSRGCHPRPVEITLVPPVPGDGHSASDLRYCRMQRPATAASSATTRPVAHQIVSVRPAASIGSRP